MLCLCCMRSPSHSCCMQAESAVNNADSLRSSLKAVLKSVVMDGVKAAASEPGVDWTFTTLKLVADLAGRAEKCFNSDKRIKDQVLDPTVAANKRLIDMQPPHAAVKHIAKDSRASLVSLSSITGRDAPVEDFSRVGEAIYTQRELVCRERC